MTAINSLQIGLEWFPERGGGLDRYFYDLLRFMPPDIMRCSGLVAGNGQSDRETRGRIHSFASPAASLPYRLLAARRAIRERLGGVQPDVVAGHFALHVFPALDMIRVPLVMHFHGPWASEGLAQREHHRLAAAIQFRIERRVYRRADRLIVLSEAFAILLHEQYGIPRDRIAVVPGSIEIDRFAQPGLTRQAARECLGWPNERRVVLAVRRLVRRMGLERLIDAVSQVVANHPDLLLMIAGNGPEKEALRARIAAADLDQHVKLLGFLPDAQLPVAYRAANCSIVPTMALEGFGLIAAESLAAGTPCLVTPVGGLPEVVTRLSPNLILRGLEQVDIVEGLRGWLGGDLQLPDEETCSNYARTMFTWDIGIERLAQQYRSVLKS